MGFTGGKGVWISTACALSVFVSLRWGFRMICAKQMESIAEGADENSAEVEDENNDEVADGGDTSRSQTLEPKHKVFLSHSGTQKDFVEQLCVDLERRDIFPFFDKRWGSLLVGCKFLAEIFKAIEQCEVGVLILSEEFFSRSKWPMLELTATMKNSKLVIMPVYFRISLEDVRDPKFYGRWRKKWCEWTKVDGRINIEEWEMAIKNLGSLNGLLPGGVGEVGFCERIVDAVCMQVPPLSRWRVSHIQGLERLGKRENLLQIEIRSKPIFLAIDNMSEDTKSIEKAKLLLKGGFHEGSKVLVTSRSLDVLKNAHLGIN